MAKIIMQNNPACRVTFRDMERVPLSCELFQFIPNSAHFANNRLFFVDIIAQYGGSQKQNSESGRQH